jgi:hypothetical protein
MPAADVTGRCRNGDAGNKNDHDNKGRHHRQLETESRKQKIDGKNIQQPDQSGKKK